MSFQVGRRGFHGIALVAFIHATVPATAWADSHDGSALAEFLNTAGRQRMLGQRMVKAYALMGLGNRAARAQLHQAITGFEEQLAVLAVLAARHPRLEDPMARVAAAWRNFDALISADVDRARADALLDADERLLNACQGLVDALRAMAGSPYSRLVDTAGRQRMLSQRLAKAYVLIAWGVEDARTHDAFVSAWNEFEEALAWLRESPQNTPELARDLEAAEEQWAWMKSAMGLHERGSYFPDIVDDAAEKILLLMERITGHYARLMKRSIS